jgi:hypothetical protein
MKPYKTGKSIAFEAKTHMNSKELIDLWLQEEQKPFSGWDFSYLDGKMLV